MMEIRFSRLARGVFADLRGGTSTNRRDKDSRDEARRTAAMTHCPTAGRESFPRPGK